MKRIKIELQPQKSQRLTNTLQPNKNILKVIVVPLIELPHYFLSKVSCNVFVSSFPSESATFINHTNIYFVGTNKSST